MEINWKQRIAALESAMEGIPNKKSSQYYALDGTRRSIMDATGGNVSHVAYLAAGGREQFWSRLDQQYRSLLPDEDNQ